MIKRPATLVLLSLFVPVVAASDARSQAWPDRPVKIVVPYAAGGTSDGVGRLLAVRLGKVFGQPFVVENRPGASGLIAAEAIARAPADGYTLFLPSVPQVAIMPATMKTSFDPQKDLVPISLLATNALALAVHPSLPVKSVADFVDYARQQHGRLTYAAVGIGSITHLAMALFLKRAGVEMTPVMYKGGAPAVTDLIAGNVKSHFGLASNVMPYAAEGTLRLLAVSSERRMPELASVPTMIESGYPGFKMLNWSGLMAPAGTPREIVYRLAREVSEAMKAPEIATRLTASGVDPRGSSPDEFAALIRTDIELWGEAVKVAGLQKQ